MKKLFILVLVLLGSSTVFGQFYEGFEGDVFPPQGWISFNNDVGVGYDWQKSDDAYTGTGAAYVRWENVNEGSAEDWLVTPLISPTQSAHILGFYQKDSYARDYFSVYTVRVSVGSSNNPSDFEVIDLQYESDMAIYYTYHEVDLSGFIGQDIYLAFVMENDDGDNWIIDDVNLSNCSPPEGLYAMNVITEGADLYWQDDGADFWSIEVVPYGEVPTGIPDATNIESMPFNWSGGEAFTRYNFYVRSNCNNQGVSNYSYAGEFVTSCSNASCDYYFVLEDTYGDDWNGAYIEIIQNGFRVGEITQLEDGFGPYYFPFSFCDDYPYELVWHSGNWDQECIFSFYDGYDQLYYSFKAGDSPENNTVFYSNVTDCDPVTCRFPFDVYVTEPTVSGAMIDWQDKDLTGQWDIEIVPFGEEPTGIPTLSDVVVKPFVWTGGEPGTYYSVYVRSVCGENDRSKWCLPGLFTTLCDVSYNDFPFEEDFRAVFELPECWSKRNRSSSDHSWKIAADTYSDDSLVYCQHDNTAQDEWLISPSFDFSAMQGKIILSFDWKASYYWMVYPYDKGDLFLRLSLDRGQSWSSVLWSEHSAGEFFSFEWQNTELDLSEYSGEPDVWVSFQYKADGAATVYLDNFKIDDGIGNITNISDPVSLGDEIKLYPNPTDDLLIVEWDFKKSGSIFSIHDLKGQQMDIPCQINESSCRLDVGTLDSGVYLITISSEDQIFTTKFVKL